jgi:hypothetical protein
LLNNKKFRYDTNNIGKPKTVNDMLSTNELLRGEDDKENKFLQPAFTYSYLTTENTEEE